MGHWQVRQDKKNKNTKGCVKLYCRFTNLLPKSETITIGQVVVNEKKHDLSILIDIHLCSVIVSERNLEIYIRITCSFSEILSSC